MMVEWEVNLRCPDHGHHGRLPLSRKNAHGRAGNRTRDLMVSSQELWPLSHEAGPSGNYTDRHLHRYETLHFVRLRVYVGGSRPVSGAILRSVPRRLWTWNDCMKISSRTNILKPMRNWYRHPATHMHACQVKKRYGTPMKYPFLWVAPLYRVAQTPLHTACLLLTLNVPSLARQRCLPSWGPRRTPWFFCNFSTVWCGRLLKLCFGGFLKL